MFSGFDTEFEERVVLASLHNKLQEEEEEVEEKKKKKKKEEEEKQGHFTKNNSTKSGETF